MKLNRLLVIFLLIGSAIAIQKPYEQVIPPDVPAPPKFRANRNSYSAIMDVLAPSRPQVTQAQLEPLKTIQFETIWTVLGDYRSSFVRGFKGTRPGDRIVGRALTLRYLPPRPDLRRAVATLEKEGDWADGFHKRAAEEVKPGDVIIVDLGGEQGSVFLGNMSAMGMKLKGAAGVIIDGGARDLAELKTDLYKDFPIYARYFEAAGGRWIGAEWNVPIRIDNVTILPGDIIVAEEEGIIAFPPEMLEEVVQKAREREKLGEYELKLIQEKKYRFRDVYPPAPELLKEFEKSKAKSP